MAKFIVCIALLCFALATVQGRPGGPGGPGPRGPGPRGPGPRGPGPHGPRPGHGDKNQWKSKICENSTFGTSFLTEIRAALAEMKNNGTFEQVLAKRQNEFAYLNNESYTDLITSNCTQFFSGLDAARGLDKAARQEEWQSFRLANDKLRDIVRAILGDDKSAKDSSEED